jgi:hypothetical protein
MATVLTVVYICLLWDTYACRQQKTSNQYKVDAFQIAQELEEFKATQQAELAATEAQAQQMLSQSIASIKQEASLQVRQGYGGL